MQSNHKKPTMAQLAKLAGVDVSTVSRALNGSPLIKNDTREMIQRIAQESGYVMNVAARNLRKQSSQVIGIVIPLRPESGQTISDPFFLEMVGAVCTAAAKRDYDLLIQMPHGDQPVSEQRLLDNGSVDGLIVIGQAGRTDYLKSGVDISNRVVVWGDTHETTKYTVVGSDNMAGGCLVGEHLLNLGRRRILFLGTIDLPEVNLRYQGLVSAHEKSGLKHDADLIFPLEFGDTHAFDSVADMVDQSLGFDAIFAASDVLATAAIHALHSKGVKVPDDVAVVGYDNIGQSSMLTPALTTVDQDIQQGAELMVDALIRKLAGETVESQKTSTNLVIRKSA